MKNFMLVLIIIAIVAAIVIYFYKVKRCGQKCIGCPYAKTCVDIKKQNFN